MSGGVGGGDKPPNLSLGNVGSKKNFSGKFHAYRYHGSFCI
jgi:hypothetical protein